MQDTEAAGAPSPHPWGARFRWGLGAAVVIAGLALDLATKNWAWDNLRGAHEPTFVWKPWIELAFALNTGTAFGLIEEIRQPWVFVPIVAAEVAFVIYLTARLEAPRLRQFAGTGLLLAGALGNLHDRFLRLDAAGRPGVVDFVKVHYPWGGNWPVFNLADVMLVVGVGLVALGFRDRAAAAAAPPPRGPHPSPEPRP